MRAMVVGLCVGSLCTFGAGAVAAEEGPSFDCAAAVSEAEKVICADADLARLDRSMSERYRAALVAAERVEGDAAQAVRDLRAFQRGWIKGRDACWMSDDLRQCVADHMQRREAELVALWTLEPTSAAENWTCEGLDPQAVETVFFDTELPTVRIVHGDMVDVGVQAPAASGAYYEARFGRSFWAKGDQATYQNTEGDTVSCVLETR